MDLNQGVLVGPTLESDLQKGRIILGIEAKHIIPSGWLCDREAVLMIARWHTAESVDSRTERGAVEHKAEANGAMGRSDAGPERKVVFRVARAIRLHRCTLDESPVANGAKGHEAST